MKTKIQALVLSVGEYKDKDGLVKVLTTDSILTLYARGLFKPNSKNLRLVQPFSYNEFMIEDKTKALITTMDKPFIITITFKKIYLNRVVVSCCTT